MSITSRSLVVRTLAILAVVLSLASPARDAAAATQTHGGFTTSARVASAQVPRGGTAMITASVTAASNRSALVDVEVHDANGNRVAQHYWDAERFTAGAARTYTLSWTVPGGQATGTYRVAVGVFSTGWGTLHHWNGDAATFTVTAQPTTPTTTPPTTAPPTTVPPTTAPPTTAPPASSRFVTLPPGSPLPSSAECAARVRPAPEIRDINRTANATRGHTFTPTYSFAAAELRRVDGAFTGTTDEIIQWAACKWGIDEDIVRAQIAKESYWNQGNLGDWWSYPAEQCPPGHGLGEDGRPGECPQSVGLGQVRYAVGDPAFPGVERSSAMNLDYTYAIWRACYEGKETWLNQVERGRDYAAGDVWGCVGRWFAGRWYTSAASSYANDVQSNLNQRIWTTPGFVNWRP